MHRNRLLAFLVISLLILSSLPALALPVDDLNTLAHYLPADTPVFISIRADDDFIQTADGLIERLNALMPPNSDPTPTISKLLNSGLRDLDANLTFNNAVRPWLGETAAVAVLSFDLLMDDTSSNDDEAPMVLAAQITDREAVLDFFMARLEHSNEDFIRTDEDTYTLLGPSRQTDNMVVGLLVTDDAIFLSNQIDAILVEGTDAARLSNNSAFTAALNRLPADDYNVTLYYDTSAVFTALAASDPDATEYMAAFGSLFSSIEPSAVGFTILDETALVFDIAQSISDPAALADAGLSMTATPLRQNFNLLLLAVSLADGGLSMTATAPVDLSFGRYILGDVPFYMQATDLNATVTQGLQNLDVSLQAQAEMMEEAGATPDQVAQIVAQIEQGFTAITGLDLYDDVLNWMTGNYALLLGVDDGLMNVVSGTADEMPLHFAFLVEITDVEAAQSTVTGLTRAFNQAAALITLSASSSSTSTNNPTAELSEAQIGGTTVSVLTITLPDVPFPIEILLGANDSVFALGTREAVTTALTGDGGLNANARYTSAQAYLLSDASSIGWFNPEGLTPLLELAGMFTSPDEVAPAEAILDAIHSVTTSTSLSEGGISLSRTVLTLSE